MGARRKQAQDNDLGAQLTSSARRDAPLAYAIAFVSFARSQGYSPAQLAKWVHDQYESTGWYDGFAASHDPDSLFEAFLTDIVQGHLLLRTAAKIVRDGEGVIIHTDTFIPRRARAMSRQFGLDPTDVESFVEELLVQHATRLGMSATISSGQRGREVRISPSWNNGNALTVREILEQDRAWLRGFLQHRWGGDTLLTRGKEHKVASASGFLATEGQKIVGVLTYADDGEHCEVLTLDALEPGRGIGRLLVDALMESREVGEVITVVTSNDNLDALGFYQRIGFQLTAVLPEAINNARLTKPSIPTVSKRGIPIRDELVLTQVVRP